jgi:hypothetical protein
MDHKGNKGHHHHHHQAKAIQLKPPTYLKKFHLDPGKERNEHGFFLKTPFAERDKLQKPSKDPSTHMSLVEKNDLQAFLPRLRLKQIPVREERRLKYL